MLKSEHDVACSGEAFRRGCEHPAACQQYCRSIVHDAQSSPLLSRLGLCILCSAHLAAFFKALLAPATKVPCYMLRMLTMSSQDSSGAPQQALSVKGVELCLMHVVARICSWMNSTLRGSSTLSFPRVPLGLAFLPGVLRRRAVATLCNNRWRWLLC